MADQTLKPDQLCPAERLAQERRAYASALGSGPAHPEVVVLEPSCLAVFRDELCELLRGDEDAGRLSEQACSLPELLAERNWHAPAQVAAQTLVNGHCHQQAHWGTDADSWLLDSGCCGMAGGFGYQREHEAVSLACAERVLASAVRSAGPDVLVVRDSFSCAGQIEHTTGRRPLHIAEVAALPLETASPNNDGRAHDDI